ncbi:MAG: CAAX prenyl protease-related protein [Acidobacteria bacterium]|nr:CAAX prenyl protease-related protein [Acidobacteriota bacterium]
MSRFLRHPAVPFVGPFVVFLALLAVMPRLGLDGRLSLALWFAVPAAAIVAWSRNELEFRPASPLMSVLVGVAVFAIWIAPDLLIPGWRKSILFQNAVVGVAQTSLTEAVLMDPVSLVLRSARAILLVPVLEELFWRGWLLRWLAEPDFRKLPLGHFDSRSFWLVAILFALEHGSYWEVGFAAGVAYNWWMVKTKRLSDVILAHAVTNGCLCVYVVTTGHWEYWL